MKSHVKLSFYPCINYMLIFNITSHQQYLKIRYLKSNWHSTNACKEKAKPLNMWRKGHSLPCKSVATRSWQGGCWVMSCEKKNNKKNSSSEKIPSPSKPKLCIRELTSGGRHSSACLRRTEKPPWVLVSEAVSVLQKEWALHLSTSGSWGSRLVTSLCWNEKEILEIKSYRTDNIFAGDYAWLSVYPNLKKLEGTIASLQYSPIKEAIQNVGIVTKNLYFNTGYIEHATISYHHRVKILTSASGCSVIRANTSSVSCSAYSRKSISGSKKRKKEIRPIKG